VAALGAHEGRPYQALGASLLEPVILSEAKDLGSSSLSVNPAKHLCSCS